VRCRPWTRDRPNRLSGARCDAPPVTRSTSGRRRRSGRCLSRKRLRSTSPAPSAGARLEPARRTASPPSVPRSRCERFGGPTPPSEPGPVAATMAPHLQLCGDWHPASHRRPAAERHRSPRLAARLPAHPFPLGEPHLRAGGRRAVGAGLRRVHHKREWLHFLLRTTPRGRGAVMPLRRKQLEVEDFEYVEAVCVERFSTFQADPVRRGQVYSLALARSEAPRILSLAWPSTRRTAAPGQVEHVMPLFSCASCGRTYPPPRRRGRCPTCARDYERRKGSGHERDYTKQHRENAARVIAAHPWCVDCGATDDLCADHIVPLSKGGTNRLNNYAVRCRGCNRASANVERRRQAATPPGAVSDRERVSPRPGHRLSGDSLARPRFSRSELR
jgi:5-methylcytosine-specific restriction enzyme A